MLRIYEKLLDNSTKKWEKHHFDGDIWFIEEYLRLFLTQSGYYRKGVARDKEGASIYYNMLCHSMTQLLSIFDIRIEKNAIKMSFFISFSTFSIAFWLFFRNFDAIIYKVNQ